MTQKILPANSRGLLTTLPRHLLQDGQFSMSTNLQLYQGALTFAPGYTKFANDVLDGTAIMGAYSTMRPTGLTKLLVSTNTDFYRWSGSVFVRQTRQVAVPAAPTATGFGSGGSLANGTYGVMLTATNAAGETTASPEDPATVSAGGGNGRIDVSWPAIVGATGYKVYATATPGSGWTFIGSTGGLTFTITAIPGGPPVGPPGVSSAERPYTGSEATPWRTDEGPPATGFANGYSFFAANGVDAVQAWDHSNGNRFRDLGGSPTDGGQHFSAAIAMFQASLFHLNRIENGVSLPTKVIWSDAGLVETYTGGIASYLTLYQGGFDPGILLEPLGPYLVAYRTNSIHLITFAGGSFVYGQRQVIDGEGLQAARACLNLITRHLILGKYNVYAFNGVDLTPIADDIRDELFGMISPGEIGRSFWAYDRLRNVAALVVPSASGSGRPDTWWMFNLTTGGWSGPITGREASGCGNWTRATALTWATVTGTWGTSALTWGGAAAISGAPVVLFGNSTKVVYAWDPSTVHADGVEITARWESRAVHPGAEMQTPALETICTELLPLAQGKIDSINWYVGVSDNPEGPFTFFGPFTRGVRGLVKTTPIRGKWFVYAAESSRSFWLSGLAANHQPSWVNP